MTGKQPTTKNIKMFRILKSAQSALEELGSRHGVQYSINTTISTSLDKKYSQKLMANGYSTTWPYEKHAVDVSEWKDILIGLSTIRPEHN